MSAELPGGSGPGPVDGVPVSVDEDPTAPIQAAELERQLDVGRPTREQRPTLEMSADAIEALRLASIKKTRDLERMEDSVRKNRKPRR